MFTSASLDRRQQCFNLRFQSFERHDLSRVTRVRIGPCALTQQLLSALPVSLEFLDWDIDDIEMTTEDVVVLQQLLERQNLKHLAVRFRQNNQVSDASRTKAILTRLSLALRDAKFLTSLDLRSNLIGNEGLQVLMEEGMKHNSSITALNLGFNLINDIGVQSLSIMLETTPASPLKHVDLSCNMIGNAGLARLSQALGGPSKSLKSLSLYGNSQVTSGSELKNCLKSFNYSLEQMNLQRTQMNDSDIAEIDYWVGLNRSGRYMLQDGNDDVNAKLPASLWSNVMSTGAVVSGSVAGRRIAVSEADRVYFFLSERLELVPQSA